MAVPAHSANSRHSDNWWLEDIANTLAASSASGAYNATQPTLSDGQSTALATDNKGNVQVVGNVASGAVDSGNPVKMGGVYRASLPTLTDGQRVDAQMDSNGRQLINGPAPSGTNITSGGINPFQVGASDGGNIRPVVVARTAIDGNAGDTSLAVHPVVYNGSNYDHMRGSAAAGLFTNVRATPTVSTVSVGTTSTSVLSANTNRKAVIFANTGANTIYLNLSGGTAVNTNVPLTAGQIFVWDTWVGSTAITAIAATAATNLSVTEMA